MTNNSNDNNNHSHRNKSRKHLNIVCQYIKDILRANTDAVVSLRLVLRIKLSLQIRKPRECDPILCAFNHDNISFLG